MCIYMFDIFESYQWLLAWFLCNFYEWIFKYSCRIHASLAKNFTFKVFPSWWLSGKANAINERWRWYGFDPVVFDPCRVLVSYRRHPCRRRRVIRKIREQRIIIVVIMGRIMTYVASVHSLQGYQVFIALRDFSKLVIDGLCKSDLAVEYAIHVPFFHVQIIVCGI